MLYDICWIQLSLWAFAPCVGRRGARPAHMGPPQLPVPPPPVIRGLRPRCIYHTGLLRDKWEALQRATGSTNALQSLLVESRIRAITTRTDQGAKLGGHPGGELSKLYSSWERCARARTRPLASLLLVPPPSHMLSLSPAAQVHALQPTDAARRSRPPRPRRQGRAPTALPCGERAREVLGHDDGHLSLHHQQLPYGQEAGP